MIHVRGLTKHYADLRRGKLVALGGIDFDVAPGQIFGLLGPNGAGKTTALRILSTVLRPTDGTVTIDGFDVVAQPAEVRRHIGFMSANTAVYDRMTAWEMVEYFGRLHGIPKQQLTAHMEQLFDRLQMNDFRDLLGAKMSTGMKQKVSVARAIVHDPPVLIFDEATAGLDVLAARALLKTVAELREHNKCIVFSTHIMREVEKLCDRVAILHRGQILAEGTLEELRHRLPRAGPRRVVLSVDLAARREAGDRGSGMNRMNWSNVRLILAREIRDQLRDRRTMFMIVAMPILLYPLLGMAFLQVAQFVRETPTRVWVIGAPDLPGEPPLIEEGRFAARFFTDRPASGRLLELTLHDDVSREEAAAAVQEGRCEAALYFPADFASRIRAFREALKERTQRASQTPAAPDAELSVPLEVPQPEIIYTMANEKSPLASIRLSEVCGDGRKRSARAT